MPQRRDKKAAREAQAEAAKKAWAEANAVRAKLKEECAAMWSEARSAMDAIRVETQTRVIAARTKAKETETEIWLQYSKETTSA